MSDHELVDVIARMGRAKRSRRDEPALVRAMEILDDKVDLLANFDGQSLDDLRATFQLLPLGTRAALEQADAIVQYDNGDAQFWVEVLPLAERIVEEAVARQSERDLAESKPLIDEEVQRIWNERFQVSDVTPATVASQTDSELGKLLDVVGMIEVMGRVRDVDPVSKSGGFTVLKKDGGEITQVSSGPATSNITSLKVGQEVCLRFVVGLPKSNGSWFKRRADLSAKRVRAELSDRPGMLLARYSSITDEGPKTVAFTNDEADSNAVVRLSEVAEPVQR